MLKILILLIILLTFGAAILRLFAKIFLYALGLTFTAATFVLKVFGVVLFVLAATVYLVLKNLLPFLAKHLARAVPWIIAAVVTAGLLIYAAGRKFLYGESIFDFIKKLIPYETRSTDFSLLLIELADSIQNDISSKLKAQYETVTNFFKPFDANEKN